MSQALMDLLLSWLTPNGIIAVGVIYSLWRMIIITREARAARKVTLEAATRSVANTETVIAVVEAQSINIQKIESATNSMKDALVSTTARASHLEGRMEVMGEAAAEAKAKAKP